MTPCAILAPLLLLRRLLLVLFLLLGARDIGGLDARGLGGRLVRFLLGRLGVFQLLLRVLDPVLDCGVGWSASAAADEMRCADVDRCR